MSIRKILSLLIFTGSALVMQAQDKWDLKRAVDYALANNISVKQADVQARLAALNLNQSKLYQYPTLNAGGSAAVASGRSINPTTNLFTTQQILSVDMGLNTGMTVFNFFSIQNNIAGNRLENEAARANIEKIQNDVALNVATAYLLVLVAYEQARIAEVTVQQSLNNVENTRKRVQAGSLPELNLAELEAQLARDSTSLITQQATTRTNILQLKALLNLDAAMPFEVSTPPLDQIPVEPLSDLQPDMVYQLALANLPQQKVLNLRIQAAEKYTASARGQMYPSFDVFAGIGSRYANNQQVRFGAPFPTGVVDTIPSSFIYNNTNYNVQVLNPEMKVPQTIYRDPFGLQVSDNFSQNIGVRLNIPIFNNGVARTAYERSKLNITTLQLQKDQDLLTLKQDIFTAYNDAVASIQKFNAGKKGVETAEKAYNFAQRRYDLGLLSTIDLLTNQTNLNRARVELAQAQVDYVFRLKLLEFYKGQGIKLQ